MKPQCRSLPEALQAAAHTAPADTGYQFLDGSTPHPLPFAQLQATAVTLAAHLQQTGIAQGDRVLLILPTGPEFALTFWALQLCGAVPCVLPSPALTREQTEGLRRIRQVATQLSARLLITTAAEQDHWSADDLPLTVTTVETLQAAAETTTAVLQPVEVSGDDLAIIQATSGSTSAPKCVALSHANLLANLQQIGQRLHVQSDSDVVVSWLPLFHDMGLIGCFLFVTYWQLTGVFMSSYRFLRRPHFWLQTITKYRGTLSPAPNFAYALTAARTPERMMADLDLSSWRSAMCGAEPIDQNTLLQFADRFAAAGFQREALTPCYGLAEASLAVTMHPPGLPIQAEILDRYQLTHENRAVIAEDPTAVSHTVSVVDCGYPMDGMQVKIVDDAGQPLPAGHIGRVVISGPSVMTRFYNDPERTTAVLNDGWLDTGDLGYMRLGRLFITGRHKDLIVVRGQNLQPADLEWLAAEVPGVKAGRVVAFGVYDESHGSEQLYLILESPRGKDMDLAALAENVRQHVGRRAGIVPAHVGLVPRNTIPRTTSGKLQRAKAKTIYLEQALPLAA